MGVMQEIGPGSLSIPERELLAKLDEMSPPAYRRQLRDAVRAEDVIQQAGIGTVGVPDTRMARAFRQFNGLVTHGYVERVKDEEGEGGIKYRLTQLAEREILTRRAMDAVSDLEAVEQKRRIAAGDARVWKAEALAARETLVAISKMRWWRFGRPRRYANLYLAKTEFDDVDDAIASSAT